VRVRSSRVRDTVSGHSRFFGCSGRIGGASTRLHEYIDPALILRLPPRWELPRDRQWLGIYGVAASTPFGPASGSGNRQSLDMDVCPDLTTIFSPDTMVEPHVHPVGSPDAPGGVLRIIVKEKIF
jgi:hypothetical protein